MPFRKWILTSLILFCPALSAQQTAVVDLVLPAQTGALISLSEQISQSASFTINTYFGGLPAPEERGDILVLVSDSLLPLLQSSYNAKLALYVNSARYEKAKPDNGSATALYSDQPISRQLALVKAIFNNQSIRLGLAYQQPHYRQQLEAAAKNDPELFIVSRHIQTDNDIQSINQIIQQCQVLLATPEEALYNPQTIRAILLSSYRHRTLMIGPSEGFVDAGALASVVSQPTHYVQDLVAMINHYLNTGELPDAKPPSGFEIKLNHSVARSLGLVLPGEETLLNRLLEQ